MAALTARRRSLLVEAGWALGAAILSSLVAIWVLQLWDGWAPTRPLAYSGDATYYVTVVKSVLEHGWYLSNPDLGAPFGLDSHDFPLVSNDALQLLIIKALGVLFDSPFTITNAFYLLTYPLAAIGGFAALRLLGVSRLPALVAAVLFATTPFHFLRGESHLFFSSYYLVPFSCLLALAVMAGEPLFTRRDDAPRWRAWATPRTIAVLVLCALIAVCGIYYAAFTVLLVAAAAALHAISARSLRALLPGVAVLVAIGAVTFLAQLPTVVYRLDHGANEAVAARSPAESELYALKLDQLVFPVEGHRIGPLARFTDDYLAQTPVRGEALSYLGLAGTVGLAWLLIVGFAAVAAAGGRRIGTQRERHAAAAALIALVVATTGGVSAIVAYALTSQLRGWNRISIFVGFFALLAFALLLQRLLERPRTLRGRRVAVAAVALILVLGVVEQTSRRSVVDHDVVSAVFTNDANFVGDVERLLPADAMVLELPYTPYPENPMPWAGGGDYQQMLGYVHSKDLRWSYPAMKGRATDWLATANDLPLPALLDGAAAAGFQGLYVDRRGYADRAAALEAGLTALLGPPVITSATGDQLFWDLRGVRDRLPAGSRGAMAEATIEPVSVTWGPGVYAREGDAATGWRWAAQHGRASVTNPDDSPRRLVFSTTLQANGQPSVTTFTFPDGTTRTVTLGPKGARFVQEFDAPPGESVVRIDTEGARIPGVPGDARELFVQLMNPEIVPPALCPRSLGSCLEAGRPQVR